MTNDNRLGKRRLAQRPYEGPNQRSTTSRRSDELEQLSDRERRDLIQRLLEEGDEVEGS